LTSHTDDRPGDDPLAEHHDLPSEPPSHRRALRAAVIVATAALGLVLGVVLVNLGDDADTPEATPSGVESSAAGSSTDSATDSAAGTGTGSDGAPSVDIEQLDGTGAVRIEVTDPAVPTSTGATSRVCVLVTYAMALDAADETGLDRQVHGCADLGGAASLSIDPSAPAVGCAAVAERQSPLADGAAPATATFTVTPAAPLQIGPFDVRVDAVTGYGDGCPPDDDHGERVASATAAVNVG
jgi:hypothetical protein